MDSINKIINKQGYYRGFELLNILVTSSDLRIIHFQYDLAVAVIPVSALKISVLCFRTAPARSNPIILLN